MRRICVGHVELEWNIACNDRGTVPTALKFGHTNRFARFFEILGCPEVYELKHSYRLGYLHPIGDRLLSQSALEENQRIRGSQAFALLVPCLLKCVGHVR